MCSAADDPTTYDIPEPQPPRVYRLAGDAPAIEFVRCPLCGDPERAEDIVGGVCLTCADAVAFSQNARRAGVAVFIEEPRGSVALAVLGELLDAAEKRYEAAVTPRAEQRARMAAFREARDRVAAAEAKL